MAIKKIGNTDVRQSWESGKRQKAERETLELVYTGAYADLKLLMLPKGTVSAAENDVPAGYEVASSDLIPLKGLRGELRIMLRELDAVITQKPLGAITSFIEIDMAQIEKPLLSKPGISDSVPSEIEMWKNAPIDLRNAMKYEQDGEPYDLSAGARIYAKLILKGVESYLVFSPVVSRTSTYKDRPDPADCGKIQTPPITVPGTWEYLKTGDRIVQQSDGKYVRTEQWTGADTWEPELYEEA